MGDELFPRLFSPLAVGPMRVPNRICETTNSIGAGAMPGLPDDAFIEHHVAKARGGTGWIGGETVVLDSPLPPEAADEFQPGAAAVGIPLYDMPGFVDVQARFVDAVHEAGAVAVFQLTHLNHALAASSVPIVEAYDWIPHELDEAGIEHIIETYAAAAARLVEAGADGFEIHCAHEATPQSFLSPALNRRTDRWGGDAVGRTRFVREILARVRARIGTAAALGIRICGHEHREGGYELLDMREMVTILAETELLDFVGVDVGHSWGAPYVQPSYIGTAEHREVGRAVRADVAPVPVLFAGRVNDPVVAEDLLASGVCDLVAMTRAGIADPDFAMKAREGRLGQIRRCIGCNRCIAESVDNTTPSLFRKAVCSVNPVVGRELEWQVRWAPAEQARRVVVVGGGAAGLETARVAAGRGHDVVVLERSDALGGQVRLAARAPGRDSFEDLISFHENELDRLGVDVRFGAEATTADVVALAPDVVVCATGSRPRWPDTPGVDAPHVVQGWDVLAGTAELGERVAVVSQEDHFETPNVADHLATHGHHVEVFHKWTALGNAIDRYSIGPVMHRIAEHGIPIHTGLRLREVDGTTVVFTSAFTGAVHTHAGFDSVVLVYGSVPDDRCHRALQAEASIERLYLVGSAWVPRQIAEAVGHGARVGLEI
jgi:2,4-dienoyl-CoA reductase-like NADH-dependent reductase (Old Yellow Enzyme family)/thioredoxin reductase